MAQHQIKKINFIIFLITHTTLTCFDAHSGNFLVVEDNHSTIECCFLINQVKLDNFDTLVCIAAVAE